MNKIAGLLAIIVTVSAIAPSQCFAGRRGGKAHPCEAVLQSSFKQTISLVESYQLLKVSEQMDPAGTITPLRTVKTITSGKHEDTDGSFNPEDTHLDTADPSSPFLVPLPTGKTETRIFFSGHRWVSAGSLDEILFGGIQTLRSAKTYMKDENGNPVEMGGKYHSGWYDWDPEVHVLNDGSLRVHGGTMPLIDGKLSPNVVEHNPSRTRMWGKVQFKETVSGQFQEEWIYENSIFGHQPTYAWLTKDFFHNYGATFYRWPDGSYVRDKDGNYYMIYDRVVEQRDGLPWNTEIYAVKVDPSMIRTIGKPVRVQGTQKSGTNEYFKVSRRDEGRAGYLFEGGRPFPVKFNGKWRWIVMFSGGNYVSDKYGIHLAVSANEDPMSEYKPVINKEGEVKDFAEVLRCVFNGTWGHARPSPFYDSRNAQWMSVHFISKAQIPEGEISDGWPASKEEFERRHRRTQIVPIKIVFHRGIPQLALDAADAPAELKDAIRRCEASVRK